MKRDIRASIDIGSNSVLLLAADMSHGKFNELSRRSEITSLGRELDRHKAFHEESMSATFAALSSYAADCDRMEVPRNEIIVTATEAARVAQNAGAFFSKVERELGLSVQILNAKGEAYYSSRGILFNSNFSSDIITLMDIGGASTELIRLQVKDSTVLDTISMPVGAVRATQWLDDQLFVQNLQKIFLDFRNEIDKFQTKELYCVAGTMTSLGNMHLERKEFVEDDVHGLILKSEDIDQMFKKYAEWSPEKFQESFPFLGKRSRSIRGGLHLVYHLSHRLLVKELSISTYGLRFGTILEGKIKKEHLYAPG
jgi:exopolyphosphatase / guanosine-5'-triphosphate,3'-diphosphate pyrophosphatase